VPRTTLIMSVPY